MDQWDASVVEQLAHERHREDLERGAAARRLPRVPGERSLRARLAGALVALAAWLDPAVAASQRPAVPLAPATPM